MLQIFPRGLSDCSNFLANFVRVPVIRARRQYGHCGADRTPLFEHQASFSRPLLILGIETSCDDTSVALVETQHRPSCIRDASKTGAIAHHRTLRVIFHERLTAKDEGHQGIHPIVALESHRTNLALLVQKAFQRWNDDRVKEASSDEPMQQATTPIIPPLEFIAVTRGPGMRSNLSVGIDTAKGLAVGMNVPLLGVHHMQAHALTPRLVSALENSRHDEQPKRILPRFPFLSVLVSGGHTMLIDSQALTAHSILAESQDIAIGEFLDKAARVTLPPQLLVVPYGRSLERFAFETVIEPATWPPTDVEGCNESTNYTLSNSEPRYEYAACDTHHEIMRSRKTKWGWAISPPLQERKGGESKRMEYSFAGLLTSVERLVKEISAARQMPLAERQELAREVQRVAFEHLASRILLYLKSTKGSEWQGDTVVVSGGVAANQYLRHVLRSLLDAQGFHHIKLAFPPVDLATDNALMIAWAGIEMWDAGHQSDLTIGPIRKWSMDPSAPDGGILGVSGWKMGQPCASGRPLSIRH